MKTRIKVMWLIKGLGMGGAEKLLEMALPYFDRSCFDYEVVYCLPQKNDLVPALEHAGIPTFCLNLKSDLDPILPFKLWRIMRDRKPDIMHIHLPYTGIMGRLVGSVSGIGKIVYTEHNVVSMYNPITRFLNFLTYPINDVTIAVSDEVYRSIKEHRDNGKDNVLVIYNGVDLSYHERDEESVKSIKNNLGIPVNHKVIGNVAHVRPEKGHEYLLQAAQTVIKHFPDTSFIIIGREKITGEIQRLRLLAEKIGIGKNIVFTGFREDAREIMPIFDVFAMSSLFEGLPIALLEAMALGIPAVATNVGGIAEVIQDGANGFLVPSQAPDELAEKIIDLLVDDDLHARMSRAASNVVQEKFSIGTMVKKVEEQYRM